MLSDFGCEIFSIAACLALSYVAWWAPIVCDIIFMFLCYFWPMTLAECEDLCWMWYE
ncbi:MAG: hypothetical protein BAJALOKI2v1_460009 [Promethearchaeota archaeon]|nr:MAG: hypothetical protein BAJALOKI2v1_460009 [Candidatus Lokiarchaeota archaeon]